MRKVKISVKATQVAAFKTRRWLSGDTLVIKRTKSGHHFANMYRDGVKLFSNYARHSGVFLIDCLGISRKELNQKLYDSTARYETLKLITRHTRNRNARV